MLGLAAIVGRARARSRSGIAIAASCALLGVAADARAQSSTAIERFEPPPPGDPSSVWAGAEVAGTLRSAFALRTVYANAPLVLVDLTTGQARREVVSHQLVLHAQASLAILDRGLVEVDLPGSLVLAGDAPLDDRDARYPEPDAPALDDVRIGGRLEIVEPDALVPAVGFGLSVWLPSGDPRRFTGTGAVRFAPSLGVSADYGPAAWGVVLSRRFEPSSEDTSDGNLLGGDLELSVGGLGRVDRFSFGGGVLLAAVTPDGADPFARRSATRLEVLAEARVKLGPLELGLFGGPGITRAPGTPRFRLGLDATASFDLVPRARADAGPTPTDEGDDDGDVLAAALSGAPPAAKPSESDRLAHVELTAPVSEVAPSAPLTPPARLEGERIAFFSPIEFATGRAELLPSSEAILREIADVLEAHPEVARLAVDGHTDGAGPPARNLELSRARALAVERWLVAHGVDARRLEARGFGAKQPIADNVTADGRAKNRRVELVVLRRTTNGEAGWVDGTLTTEAAK